MQRKSSFLLIKALIPVSLAIITGCVIFLRPLAEASLAYYAGCRAQEEGRHSTAIKEFERARERFPDSASITARLAISYFHNEKMDECRRLLSSIAGKEVSQELSRRVNKLVEKLDSVYYESSELVKILRLYGREELERTAQRLEAFLEENKNSIMGLFHLANIYFDLERYDKAERLYIRVTELEPEFYSAYLNLAAFYRETGRLEEAWECCSKVLESSREHPQAFVALSRIEFERGNKEAGLEYAKKAYEYDSGDLLTISNLCLAYHYNNMTEDRDMMFELLKEKDYYDMAGMWPLIEGTYDTEDTKTH